MTTLGAVGLRLSVDAGLVILMEVIENWYARILLGSLGFGALVAAAGAFWPATLAIFLGGLITVIPNMILKDIIITRLGKDHPSASFALIAVLNIATSCCAAMIGATILGLAANPITLCALGGAITLTLIGVGAQLIMKGLFSGKKEEKSANKSGFMNHSKTGSYDPSLAFMRSSDDNLLFLRDLDDPNILTSKLESEDFNAILPSQRSSSFSNVG